MEHIWLYIRLCISVRYGSVFTFDSVYDIARIICHGISVRLCVHPSVTRLNCTKMARCIIEIKVVIWLPVNRLPVKLPVTGFNSRLPVTDLPTFFSARNGFSFVSRTRTGEQWQAYIGPRHTGAVNESVPLVQVYPVFDCRVCSSPLPASGRRSRERQGGKRCELDGRRWWHRLRPRVTARRFFWSNRCCMHGRARWFNVDGDMSRFSWPSLALLGLHSNRRYP